MFLLDQTIYGISIECDKIKSYGFAIHDAIDGFSRKILWLRVASSNNNPKVIASYYMDCIGQLRLIPGAIRSDWETESMIICGIQRFLRRNAEDLISNKGSFVYGSSTRNQRIKCWWSILRRRKLSTLQHLSWMKGILRAKNSTSSKRAF